MIPFDYHGQPVPSLLIDNGPWFVAKDVCDVLEIQNPTQAVNRLDEDERAMFNIVRQGETNIVSESGLYSLTLGSKKPQAKPFKRWVTHEVIPAIRKTGSYSAHPMTQIEMLAAQAQQMVELEKKTNIAIESANSAQKQLSNAVDALAAPTPENWQQATGDKIKHICKLNGLSYLKEYDKLYRELEHNAHVDLQSRVSRLKGRMKKAGYTFKECGKVTQLHVISRDPVLKLAFDGIVRRFAAKYANTEVKND
ncbi:MAG TPA: phage antirepressor [Ruminococcaceae bacterium]|nr:phage antirepressor [Oscillospiraceae bacterium]